jgi:phosphoribosyl 1,2-cyclic phosphodiesterase
MDMKLCVLGSSSEGNATLLWTKSTGILIDAGFSGRELEKRLKRINIDPKDLDAIVLSHEHSDHTKGAGVLSRRYGIPIYANPTTFDLAYNLGDSFEKRFIKSYEDFKIGDLFITPIVVPHDASEPNAFIIRNKSKKVTIATDMGTFTPTFIEYASDSYLIVLESNYDRQMLLDGPYPPYLKGRILSDFGHLSNGAAGRTLRQLIGSSTRHVLLAHISQNNNTPDLAISSAQKHLKDFKKVKVGLTFPHDCSEIIKI